MKIVEKFKKINKLNIFEKCRKTHKIAEEEDFGYLKLTDIIADLDDEIVELKEELILEDNIDRIKSELGDVLFVLCNLAEQLDIDLENALDTSTNEFQRRMIYMENNSSGRHLRDLNKEERNHLWKKAKTNK